MNNKFISDFFIIPNDKNALRHLNDWVVFDLNKANGRPVKFRYGKKLKDLLLYREKIKRPVFFQMGAIGPGYYLPVNLMNSHTRQTITTLAVADSGAACSCFSHEIAEAIGLNWKKGRKSRAFKGEKYTPLYVYQVKLMMNLLSNKKYYPEKVDIIKEKRSVNLLGLSGLFNHHQVIFDPKFGIRYKFIK